RPILGEMAGAEGVYFASGGSHVGMTLGPVMGRITADLVAGRDPGINLDPYRPDRW
ncbi:MAG: FAD-binding oxidoreductase, partial [Alphaproteobacteria bacterium]|nr:FAD-binding oxidoreductase [Alphaproteobacteria bacterium]